MIIKSKRQQAVAAILDKYVLNYKIATGHRPTNITIYKNQADTIKWEDGDRRQGIPVIRGEL